MDTVEELLEDQLKDIYNAENQLIKAMPRMAKFVSSPELKKALEMHLEQTREQVERLKQVGEELGIKLTGKKCAAMEGLLEEGKEVMQEDGHEAVLDAALLAAAQRIEHYEISAYGSARALAEKLGETKVAKLLQKTLDEESATDEKLTKISEGSLLADAPLREEDLEAVEE